MDDPSKVVSCQLFDSIEIVRWLNSADPDPSPGELEAIEQRYAMYGGIANTRVLDRWWVGFPHYSGDQILALLGGDSYEFD